MLEQNIEGIDFFLDLQPKLENFKDAVIQGLGHDRKYVPPKFFYDTEGSELFDQICETQEYYVTRTEIALISAIGSDLQSLIGLNSSIIEYGCGSSLKIRALLSTLMSPSEYFAIDISKSHLIKTVREIAKDYPSLRVGGVCADFSEKIVLDQSKGPSLINRLGFFPGSTIGNQTPDLARILLERMSATLGSNGQLLIGVDTKKDADLLNQAYNDKLGYTAKFNLNLLTRIKRELQADFDVTNFQHKAFYNESEGRIEMHLNSKEAQDIVIDDVKFSFKKGESIHTESSYKYTEGEFSDLLSQSGFSLVKSWSDPAELFRIYLAKVK
ncbi:MAG: L-histidine N(alpha)-methyltransferase [Rhodospirillaceae bacterium]|jgi:dimethylhistidine N-methyltransferase|nr:L-histidine N(alpha)-methyltransferase [Rhodospirillaceae bacterium]|tara:strand:+ start:1482 stop:2462 length:981 start_codon:yes stop_codon:yes gene_type:complete